MQLAGITVSKLISDSDLQAKVMKMVADRVDSLASVSYMDLSLEAEAFGADVKVSDDEVPTVVGTLIHSEEEADALKVPALEDGRVSIYIDSVKKALTMITDRPLFAGIIGPFSLAGCTSDRNEQLTYMAKAATEYGKAQCYAQKAQNDPSKLIREGEGYEVY